MFDVEIVKPPLYGSVYWDGENFIYTPNENYRGNDYYIYSGIINGIKQIKTNYVNTENFGPIPLNPSLSATIKNVNTIPLNLLVSDTTIPFDYLELISVENASNGKIYIKDNSLYYESTIFNFVESLSYQVSDGQYTSTGILTLSVIDGFSLNAIPLSIKKILKLLLEKTKTVENLSGYWMDTYSVLTSFSADWDASYEKYVPFFNFLDNIFVNWYTLTSIQNDMDTIVSLMISESSNWQSNYLNGLSTYNFINPKAENYNLSYDILLSSIDLWNSPSILSSNYYNFKPIFDDITSVVFSNSATLWDSSELNSISALYFDNWISTYNYIVDKFYYYIDTKNYRDILSSGLVSISADVVDMVNTVSSNSATTWEIIPETHFYELNSGYSLLSSNSANYDLTKKFSENVYKYDDSYKTLQENITSKWIPETFNKILTSDNINWNSTYEVLTSLSSNWFFDNTRKSLVFYTNLTGNSSNWNNAYTILESSSSNYESTKNNVNLLSTKYLTGSFDTDFTVNNLNISDSLTTRGSVYILGEIKKYDTTFVTTSSFIIYNESTNNALDVLKIGGNKIATFTNPNSARILYVNSDNKVGINMLYDGTEALTISGNISASGNIYPYLTDTINTFKSVSGSYENTYNVLTSISATTIAEFLSSKPNYDNLVNYINLSSSTINNLLTGSYGRYNSLYSVTTAQSTLNDFNYTFLTNNSGDIGKDQHFRDNKYLYDTIYNIYLQIQ